MGSGGSARRAAVSAAWAGGRAIEGSEEFQVGRIVFEILRPVPIGPVTVETRVLRPGRKVRMVEASLSGEAGELMRATRLAAAHDRARDAGGGDGRGPAPQGPEEGWSRSSFRPGRTLGYHTGMELKAVAGAFLELGPATFWLRMRQPLVAGEEPTPLQRALIAADVGNGISAVLDYHSYVFINVDLTVHFERMPAGEWVCVDAVTRPQPTASAPPSRSSPTSVAASVAPPSRC